AAGICYGEPAVPSANTVLDQANCSDRAFDQASGRCDKSGASRPPAPKPPQPPVPVPTSKFDLPIGRELAGVPEPQRPKKIAELAERMLKELKEPADAEQVKVLSEWLTTLVGKVPADADAASTVVSVDLQGHFRLNYSNHGKPTQVDTEFAIEKLPGHGPEASPTGG